MAIEPPYLVVAEDGKRVQKLVMDQRGLRSLRSKIKCDGVWGETKRAMKQLLNRPVQKKDRRSGLRQGVCFFALEDVKCVNLKAAKHRL